MKRPSYSIQKGFQAREKKKACRNTRPESHAMTQICLAMSTLFIMFKPKIPKEPHAIPQVKKGIYFVLYAAESESESMLAVA